MQHFRGSGRSALPGYPGHPSRGRSLRRACAAVTRLLLCFAGLVAFTAVRAQPPTAPTHENISWPSPDGKLAFLASIGEDQNALALIDGKSRKIVQQIEDDRSSQTTWRVLWAPNSNRFALMTRVGHPIQGLDVYFRRGERFRKIDLPEMPADIPERLKHGKNFPHYANLNWQEARRWTKDGSLVVNIDTMIDGDGSSILATRTVVLRFDWSGKARIAKSAIKYETKKN